MVFAEELEAEYRLYTEIRAWKASDLELTHVLIDGGDDSTWHMSYLGTYTLLEPI